MESTRVSTDDLKSASYLSEMAVATFVDFILFDIGLELMRYGRVGSVLLAVLVVEWKALNMHLCTIQTEPIDALIFLAGVLHFLTVLFRAIADFPRLSFLLVRVRRYRLFAYLEYSPVLKPPCSSCQ
jgi:hypothetical protein